MVRSVEEIYRSGKVEPLEPAPATGDSRVIVTFPSNGTSVDLARKQISPQQAADLRNRLKSFQEDWDRPEMDVYDAL